MHMTNRPQLARRVPLALPLTAIALLAAFLLAPSSAVAQQISITEHDDRVSVHIGNDLFTEYLFEGARTPILYPVYGPGNRPMTRNFPMREVEGEANDHPHHRSIFFGHIDVNGHSFWHRERIQNVWVRHRVTGDRAFIAARNEWLDPDDNVVLEDTTLLLFSTIGPHRVIDFQITLHANNGDVTFGDDKDGLMGIRTHPNLRLRPDPNRGVQEVYGQSVNSEGVENAEMWGKRAHWLSYWGPIDDKVVGVAIMDHPSNLRHPTWWHARDYGLVSANPFGISDFEGAPAGSGDFTLENGQRLTLLYRFIFHEGSAEEADIPALYEQFTETQPILRRQNSAQ
jgi:hypothetical protein